MKFKSKFGFRNRNWNETVQRSFNDEHDPNIIQVRIFWRSSLPFLVLYYYIETKMPTHSYCVETEKAGEHSRTSKWCRYIISKCSAYLSISLTIHKRILLALLDAHHSHTHSSDCAPAKYDPTLSIHANIIYIVTFVTKHLQNFTMHSARSTQHTHARLRTQSAEAYTSYSCTVVVIAVVVPSSSSSCFFTVFLRLLNHRM